MVLHEYPTRSTWPVYYKLLIHGDCLDTWLPGTESYKPSIESARMGIAQVWIGMALISHRFFVLQVGSETARHDE